MPMDFKVIEKEVGGKDAAPAGRTGPREQQLLSRMADAGHHCTETVKGDTEHVALPGHVQLLWQVAFTGLETCPWAPAVCSVKWPEACPAS